MLDSQARPPATTLGRGAKPPGILNRLTTQARPPAHTLVRGVPHSTPGTPQQVAPHRVTPRATLLTPHRVGPQALRTPLGRGPPARPLSGGEGKTTKLLLLDSLLQESSARFVSPHP